MAKRVLLCLSHAVEEHDQLLLLSELGYDVFSIGGYICPQRPHDWKREPLPDVPYFPELQEAVDRLGTPDNLGAAQARIPQEILDWLGPTGVIIFHHYLDQRLWPQWDYLREWRAVGGRVVWRTVGQSVEHNERLAAPYRADGLEIVRYSPREQKIPGFAGQDALIRFWKDEHEWSGWTGERAVVTNVTQQLAQRGPWCNVEFWRRATRGLPTEPAGEGSEALPSGRGKLALEEMQALLRVARCYLYTGTQPASYTLGLVEALMTGIPTVSIGHEWMRIFPYGPELFEAPDLCSWWTNDPGMASEMLHGLLAEDLALARTLGESQRRFAQATFGKAAVGEAWRDFLGEPV